MNYEAHLWAAFPKADNVIAQPMEGGNVGIGIQLGDYRQGISFNPRTVKLRDAIKQLTGFVLADLA